MKSNCMQKTTEQTSNYRHLEKMSTAELLQNMNNEDKTVPHAIEKVLPVIEKLVDEIADRMLTGGRLFYIGAGTSGRLGIVDASECPPTFGVEQGLVIGLIAGGDAAPTEAAINGWVADAGTRAERVLVGAATAATIVVGRHHGPFRLEHDHERHRPSPHHIPDPHCRRGTSRGRGCQRPGRLRRARERTSRFSVPPPRRGRQHAPVRERLRRRRGHPLPRRARHPGPRRRRGHHPAGGRRRLSAARRLPGPGVHALRRRP